MLLWVTQNHFITGKSQWHQTCASQHDIHQECGGKERGGRAKGLLHECPPGATAAAHTEDLEPGSRPAGAAGSGRAR